MRFPFFDCQNMLKKGMNYVISINRNEAFHMREVGMGKYVHISSRDHKSLSKHYWLTESQKALNELEKYRKSIKCEE